MSRPLIFLLLAVAGLLAVVGAVMEEISAPLWATAALTGVAAVVGILVKKPLERIGDRADPLSRGKHLVHGRPLRVRDTVMDVPGYLGVHHARYRDPEDVYSDRLPDYVPRRDLERRVRERLEAHGIVVVTGGSATGKSRLAYEMVREMYPDRYLHRPVVPDADTKGVRGIVEEGLLPKKAVFWLDGLEAHLAQGLRAEDITALVPPGSGNVVVATMRVHPGGVHTGGGGGEQDQEAFLRRFSGNEVQVPRGNEGYAEHDSDDPRIREAFTQERNSVTEYLAQGPAAHERWRRLVTDSHTHRAGAVITAAVDSRRAGRHTPLSVELLCEMHEYYIDDSEGAGAGRQTFEEALVQAAEPINGASGCLLGSDRSPGAYYAFDYLVDRAQAEDNSAVDTRVLGALIEDTEGPELVSLGRFAEADPRLALRAADKRLTESPEDAAALGLRGTMLLVEEHGIDVADKVFGDLEWGEGTPEAVDCLRRAVDGEDETVPLLLGAFLQRSGRYEEALGHLERVEAPDALVHQRIGMCLRALGRYEEALERFSEARGQGLVLACFSLSSVLLDLGRPELALSEYDTLLELARGDEELRAVELLALRRKGELLFGEGRIAEAVEFAEEGAERSEAWAFDLLTEHFETIGNHGMVRLWRHRAADAGMLWALRETDALSGEDVYESLETWRKRVRDAGDQRSEQWLLSAEVDALSKNAEALSQEVEEIAREGEERLRQDTSWIRKVLEAGGNHQLVDTEDEAEESVHRPEDTVDEDALEDEEPSVDDRAAELRNEGRHRELVVLLGGEVAAGRDEFVAPLDEALNSVTPTERVELLRETARPRDKTLRVVLLEFIVAGLESRAEELLLAEVEDGDQWAVNELTGLYRRQERFTELREHLRHQIYLGSPTAAADLVDHLARVDDFEAAYQDLLWPLASFARSGGEMSASMHLSFYVFNDDKKRFTAEAAEAGVGPAQMSLIMGLLAEGRVEEAEEAFANGENQPHFVYRPGAYLLFAEELVNRGEGARAGAVLDRAPVEGLSEEEETRWRELRAWSRSARDRRK